MSLGCLVKRRSDTRLPVDPELAILLRGVRQRTSILVLFLSSMTRVGQTRIGMSLIV